MTFCEVRLLHLLARRNDCHSTHFWLRPTAALLLAVLKTLQPIIILPNSFFERLFTAFLLDPQVPPSGLATSFRPGLGRSEP